MLTLNTILPILALTTAIHTVPDEGDAGGPVFDAGALREMLTESECTGLRFYNIMLVEGGASTVMVIGIKADGSEQNGGFLSRPYKASVGTLQDPMAGQWLSRGQAAEACQRIATAGQTSYSASVGKDEILPLLELPGCSGLGVMPGATGSGFMLVAMSSEGGSIRRMGEGSGYERLCGDPCPNVCGPVSNYINEALLSR